MVIAIDRNHKLPVWFQIKEKIIKLIREGYIKPGSRLPPTRELACSLHVSRNTVVTAYQELEAGGYISSSVGKGTFVQNYLPHGAWNKPVAGKPKFHFEGLFSRGWSGLFSPGDLSLETLFQKDGDETFCDFSSTSQHISLYPLEEFRDSLHAAMRRYGAKLLSSGDPRGFQNLIEYLVVFLARRNVLCKSENLIIVSGIQQGLEIVTKLFINPGDTVIMENLTYPGAIRVFRSCQANCVGIPVDEEGMRVDVLESVLKRIKAKLVYTIPTFHNPTGFVMSQNRREKLIRICMENQVVIVEDDYAYELNLDGRGILPVRAFNEHNSVIYMGSFSEVLFPGMRLSWIEAPEEIIERLTLIKEASDLYTNRIMQGALVEFSRRGLLDRIIKKKRFVYRDRLNTMLTAMAKYFPEKVRWYRPRGGVFVWVELPRGMDTLKLLLKVRERGVVFVPDRVFTVEEIEQRGFRLCFASMEKDKIEGGIKVLGEVLKSFKI